MSPKVLDEQALLTRENKILDCAVAYIQDEGVSAMTIDKLAQDLPYSKGTIYNHFSCKEDLIVALCNRSIDLLTKMFQRAIAFQGGTREQALAIHFAYMLYAKLYPTNFLLVITAMSASVKEKASDERQQQHVTLEGQLLASVASIFEKALERGDCQPPIPISLKQMVFSCWSVAFGTSALLLTEVESCSARSELIVECEFLNGIQLIFDGLCWKPLSHEYDWGKTINLLKSDIFSDEIAILKSRGQCLAI